VVAEPVTGSRFGRVVGKIPLLRRLRKPTDTFVPPSPTHEVRPELNAENRRSLRRAVPVDVKVYVAESGKVRYAELLSDGTGERRELASAAIYAARRWDFVPARLGDENVPGEVILHFKFTPVE
jgi:TonB family protein